MAGRRSRAAGRWLRCPRSQRHDVACFSVEAGEAIKKGATVGRLRPSLPYDAALLRRRSRTLPYRRLARKITPTPRPSKRLKPLDDVIERYRDALDKLPQLRL